MADVICSSALFQHRRTKVHELLNVFDVFPNVGCYGIIVPVVDSHYFALLRITVQSYSVNLFC